MLSSLIGLSCGGTSDRVVLAVAPEVTAGLLAETSVGLGGCLFLGVLDDGLGSGCLGKEL